MEWDETFLAKRLHHRGGRVRKAGVRTVVGGAHTITENGRRRVIDIAVANVPTKGRTDNVPLLNVLAAVGAEVSTDCAKMYDGLSGTGVVHHQVNHKEGLVNADGAHTNSIEGMWSVIKRTLRGWFDHQPPSEVSFSLNLQLASFVARFNLRRVSVNVALVNLLRWSLKMTATERSRTIWNVLFGSALEVFGKASYEEVRRKQDAAEAEAHAAASEDDFDDELLHGFQKAPKHHRPEAQPCEEAPVEPTVQVVPTGSDTSFATQCSYESPVLVQSAT